MPPKYSIYILKSLMTNDSNIKPNNSKSFINCSCFNPKTAQASEESTKCLLTVFPTLTLERFFSEYGN